ncbi:hypothetical protein ACOMHN_033498 [Nucella lapillus]
MLDIAPSTENRSRSMMSVDLSPYLLSASPPISDFSLHSLTLTSSFGPYPFFSAPSSRAPPVCAKVYGKTSYNPPLKSIMSVSSRDDDSSETLNSTVSSSQSSFTSQALGKRGKRVSFADETGLPLAEVRTMLENHSVAPQLNLRGVSIFHGEGGNADGPNPDDEQPPLLTPDPQPLARVNFEENLRRNLVGVENVVVQGYEVKCTILVNSRPSSKRVFARYTMDSWQSFQDVTASFSQSRMPGFDTYQFCLQVPRAADRSKSIQFAACYDADGVQHWDNNEGRNFTVHWNWRARVDPSFPCVQDLNANALDFGDAVLSQHEGSLDNPYY